MQSRRGGRGGKMRGEALPSRALTKVEGCGNGPDCRLKLASSSCPAAKRCDPCCCCGAGSPPASNGGCSDSSAGEHSPSNANMAPAAAHQQFQSPSVLPIPNYDQPKSDSQSKLCPNLGRSSAVDMRPCGRKQKTRRRYNNNRK